MSLEIDKSKIKRILIIRLSAIGDVIRVLPSYALLRERFPDAEISWMVEENAYDILGGMSGIDEIILLPRKRLTQKVKKPHTFFSAFLECVRFLKDVKNKKFDVVLDYHGLLKSGIISYFSGAPIRLGFAKGFSKEMNHLFNNRKIGLPVPKLSRVTRNLLLTEELTGKGNLPKIYIETTEEDNRAVDDIETEHLSRKRPRVIVHPGTSPKTIYKRWGADRFAVVSDILISELAAEVIITYGPGEKDTATEVRNTMKQRAIIIDKPLKLRELAELYRRSDIYIGGDTGPMHIASFVGTPVVAIFGPTDPVENEPYKKTPFVMIRKPIDCSPCRKRNCVRGVCFEDILPREVANAAMKLLSGDKKVGTSGA